MISAACMSLTMGKRSTFPRSPRDFYPTPYEAVVPLLPHLVERTFFHEPCCGNGQLIGHLEAHGHRCLGSSDIEPHPCVGFKQDAMTLTHCLGIVFITNPPWLWSVLNPMITHLSTLAPTWLLLNADQMHNKRMGPHLRRCTKIVSIGRVKWMPDSTSTGMENSAWFLFDQNHDGPTVFVGR
jgi:hypothetical protein